MKKLFKTLSIALASSLAIQSVVLAQSSTTDLCKEIRDASNLGLSVANGRVTAAGSQISTSANSAASCLEQYGIKAIPPIAVEGFDVGALIKALLESACGAVNANITGAVNAAGSNLTSALGGGFVSLNPAGSGFTFGPPGGGSTQVTVNQNGVSGQASFGGVSGTVNQNGVSGQASFGGVSGTVNQNGGQASFGGVSVTSDGRVSGSPPVFNTTWDRLACFLGCS